MPGIARVGIDIAGGVIVGVLAPGVFVDGANVAVLNCTVAGHGPMAHGSPRMAECSSTVFAHGIGVCRAGDKATCGCASTGSSTTFAG